MYSVYMSFGNDNHHHTCTLGGRLLITVGKSRQEKKQNSGKFHSHLAIVFFASTQLDSLKEVF